MKSIYQFGDKLIIFPEVKSVRCDGLKVIVEYKARPVFVFNPATLKYQKEVLSDLINISFDCEKDAIQQYSAFCACFHAYISERYQ